MAERWRIRQKLGLDSEEFRKEWDDRFALSIGVLAGLLVLATGVGAVLMLWRVYTTGPVPGTGNPLETIFASRLMLAAARLAILFVGLYVVLSILVHVRRGHWLTGVGSLRISDSVRSLSAQQARGFRSAQRLRQENERLQERLSESLDELREKNQLLDRIEEQLKERED